MGNSHVTLALAQLRILSDTHFMDASVHVLPPPCTTGRRPTQPRSQARFVQVFQKQSVKDKRTPDASCHSHYKLFCATFHHSFPPRLYRVDSGATSQVTFFSLVGKIHERHPIVKGVPGHSALLATFY